MRAAFLIFLFAATGSLIRLSRRDFDLFPVLAPLDFHGTSTNFVVCAGMPFVAFCFKDVIGFSYYVKTALGTAVGLSIYELVQIYLPNRTFDPHDIVASFLGAIFSILLASILFLMQRTNYNTIVRSKNDNAV
jgi:VanZ family protein